MCAPVRAATNVPLAGLGPSVRFGQKTLVRRYWLGRARSMARAHGSLDESMPAVDGSGYPNLRLYTHRRASSEKPKIALKKCTLNACSQLEIVLIVKSIYYLGIGWQRCWWQSPIATKRH